MAGHSKWSKIKRKKAANDRGRGKLFSKLVKEITVAAREGGGDPDHNARLSTAIDAAKRENMPASNIEREIKRGTGELPGTVYEEVTYEGFGPGNSAIIVQTATDNRNRTVSELRKIFEKAGGNLGQEGSVGWMFKAAGLFLVDADAVGEDEILMAALEAGAEDVRSDDGMYEVVCPPGDFHTVQRALEEVDIPRVEEHARAMLPTSMVSPEGKEMERFARLLDDLDDHDDVQDVWANAEVDEEMAEQMAKAS